MMGCLCTVGPSLTRSELSKALLSVKMQINRRPLSYVKDHDELPIRTPANFLFKRTNQLPEEQTWKITDRDIRRRAKYLRTCKDTMWGRWQREYLTALRKTQSDARRPSSNPKKGDVIILKTDNKYRGTRPLAVIMCSFMYKMYKSARAIMCMSE